MKRLILLLLLIPASQLQAQKLFIAFENSHGIATYGSQLIPTKVRYSTQSGFQFGMDINHRFGFKIGLDFQIAGARTQILYINPDNSRENFDEIYNQYFLKFPFDIGIRFGNRFRYAVDIGGYYGFLLNSFIGTDSDRGLPGIISISEIQENDYGLRINPSMSFPIAGNFSLSFGVLQEIGLKEFLNKTRHLRTFATLGLKYQFSTK